MVFAPAWDAAVSNPNRRLTTTESDPFARRFSTTHVPTAGPKKTSLGSLAVFWNTTTPSDRAAGREITRLVAAEASWHGGGGGTLGYCAPAPDAATAIPAANKSTDTGGFMAMPSFASSPSDA